MAAEPAHVRSHTTLLLHPSFRAVLPALLAVSAACAGGGADGTPGPAPSERGARATGTFDVEMTPLASDDEPEGSSLGRFRLEKRFHGDLTGTSEGEMLTARTPVPESAGYVALERVSGTLAGRSGTFVLQHSGTMSGGRQELRVSVVPDSGTGGLVGLAGTMRITVTPDEHAYELEYTLPEEP